MANAVAPEFARFVASERRAKGLTGVLRPTTEGEAGEPVLIAAGKASALIRVAARRAAGLFPSTRHTEVVWVEGESELAVDLVRLRVELDHGMVRVLLPVRCDQSGQATVEVPIACGSPEQPAGLYAATRRRPIGPELIVATWGDALVAFAWQCLLAMATGIAGATGKDRRGNVLVPVELVVSPRGIAIVPMARHRFAGGSGLKRPGGKVRR